MNTLKHHANILLKSWRQLLFIACGFLFIYAWMWSLSIPEGTTEHAGYKLAEDSGFGDFFSFSWIAVVSLIMTLTASVLLITTQIKWASVPKILMLVSLLTVGVLSSYETLFQTGYYTPTWYWYEIITIGSLTVTCLTVASLTKKSPAAKLEKAEGIIKELSQNQLLEILKKSYRVERISGDYKLTDDDSIARQATANEAKGLKEVALNALDLTTNTKDKPWERRKKKKKTAPISTSTALSKT